MTSDMKRPPEKRRNYTHVGNALTRIVREEGFLSMWKGATPTVTRAVILNAAQLSVYSQAKEVLVQNFGLTFDKESIKTHFVASVASAFICTAVSLPVDIVKTRVQTADAGQYKGSIDVFLKVIRSEGPLALWKGFTPYFLRLGPHTILTFIFNEQMLKLYQSM
jgi:solute carrier family 25 oxoglutarate transporter 11